MGGSQAHIDLHRPEKSSSLYSLFHCSDPDLNKEEKELSEKICIGLLCILWKMVSSYFNIAKKYMSLISRIRPPDRKMSSEQKCCTVKK